MEPANPRRALVWSSVALAAILLAAGAWYVFAPRLSQTLDEPAPDDAMALAGGTFRDGAPGHTTSGAVTLLRDADGHLLHFEDYDATPGPAVYFYLTRPPSTDDASQIEDDGVLLGAATARGSFNLRVPEGVEVAEYGGIAVWCERFNVLFGSAPLA